jgi:hypothetical protein
MICYSANPLMCDGAYAAPLDSRTPFQHDALFSTASIPDSLAGASAAQRHRANAALQTRSSSASTAARPVNFRNLSNAALTGSFARYCEPLLVHAVVNDARKTDGTSRSEFGDPVCRLSGFRYSGFRFTWPALQSL